MSEFCLPDVGEGLTEAEIITWHVAVGDTVAVNDVLVDIETAKSIVELPSPFAGRIGSIRVAEGQTVPVGTPIVDIEQAEKKEVLVGYGPREETVGRRRRRPRLNERAPRSTRTLAKPPVRKLAKDLGLDLAGVPHDGDVVTRDDVLACAKTEPGEPISGVRKATAAAMTASAEIPQVTEWITLDATRTVELVDDLKADRAFADVKVSPTLIVAKAVCLALGRHRDLNARWAGDTIEFNDDVHLGIAAATDRGLVVPVVRDAHRLGLLELGSAIGALVATARAGRLQPDDMTGGTFTITNVGVFGVDAGTPLLNPGQSGILAVGSFERRPWVVTNAAGLETIAPRWVTTLALSFDHRVVDGEQGSKFLADVAALLRDPARALTY